MTHPHWHPQVLCMVKENPLYFSPKNIEAGTHIARQKTQTDGSKGNSAANMVLKVSL